MAFKLPKELIADFDGAVESATSAQSDLENASANIDAAIDDLRGEFEERSEKWQEGDRGEAVGEWLDELEETRDIINGVLDSLSEVIDRLNSVDDTPNF